MHRAIAAWSFLVLGAWHPGAAAQDGSVDYRVRIDAPRELREMLADGLQLLRWQGDPQMSEALLARLVAEAEDEVREAVATRGYFSARVAATVDRSARPWTVTLEVEPGPPAEVGAAHLRFTGPAAEDARAAPLLERIRRDWKLPPGERFTQEAWNEAKQAAAGELAQSRYAAARIAGSRARVRPGADRQAPARAELEVELESGPPFRFGPVEVTGVERYPAALVARLATVSPGEPYEREALRRYERRLIATGYFVSAQAGLEADPARADAAPVRVAVLETRSQQAETGLSFNTDVGVRAEARYRNMDLFDTAWRLRSELQLDQRIRNGRLDLDAPPREGGRWWSGFAQARDTRIQNERNLGQSAGIAHNWDLGGEPSALLASVHVEESRVTGEPTDHRNAVYLGWRKQFRATDSWESPRRGVILDVSAGGAPGRLATRAFSTASVRALLFIPVGQDDLLLRGEAGVVAAQSSDGIPSAFLYRTGGDQTVRGYSFQSLGVRRGDAIVGGRYLAIASAEYTRWLGEGWGVAAFVDAGNAWDAGGWDPAVGAGLGARVRTPIGPVRADLAYGVETRRLRLHFSVGFSF